MRRFAIPAVLSLCFCNLVFGNSWVARYSGGGWEEAYAMAIDSSGNVYVTGVGNGDYVTIKYDPNGNEVWESRYNGPSNGYDAARAIALDNSGNVYVTGNSYDDANWDDYLTVKYDSNGGELWTARLDGPAHQSDFANAIAVSADGSVYVTGSSVSTDVNSSVDYNTVKYNSSGVLQWAKRYNYCSDWDMAYAIAVDKAGNAYVTGESYSDTNGADYTTIKYSSSGSQQWAKRYPSTRVNNNVYDSARAIAIDDSNNVYVTGESDQNYLTIKYNSGGTIQSGWPKIYDGTGQGYDIATAIAVDSSGNVYITGQSYEGETNGNDYATVKYSLGGTQLWATTYNGPVSGSDVASAIAVDGNVYVTGTSYGGDVIDNDYATIKYDSSGNQLWEGRYNSLSHDNDSSADIAVDNSGNVYVTGTSYGFDTYNDYLTIKNPNEISYCRGPVDGDLNNDCVVDFADFGVFASHWLESNYQ